MPRNSSELLSFAHFARVLELRNNSGLPYVLIGGQAVNYRAETYLPIESELARFLPFASKDIDFLGNRADVLRAARFFSSAAKFPHKRMMTAFAGGVGFYTADMETNVEFLRSVPGVSQAEVIRWTISAERDGMNIRVLDPISLLKCKLLLALKTDQTGRRDADHARVLFLCTRGFLRETLQLVETGELPARGWLGAVERVLKLAESTTGMKAERQFRFDWQQVLPRSKIEHSSKRLIHNFRSQRLPVWLAKLNRRGAVGNP